jgi:hypothetical protein
MAAIFMVLAGIETSFFQYKRRMGISGLQLNISEQS